MSEKRKRILFHILVTVAVIAAAAVLGAVTGEFLLDNLI